MLWNGYREKHKAKFLLQGPDSTVSAASTLEEHTVTVSRVDKFRGKEDHGPAFMMLPKCKSGATTQINQPLRQMNTECGEMHYTVLSRSHKWRYCLFFTKKWINFLWPELEGFARDQWSPCDCGGGCRYSQYFCRVFWDSAAQQVVLAMVTHPLLLAPSILFPIYREPMHYIFQKTFLSTPLALFFQGERHSVISFILQ